MSEEKSNGAAVGSTELLEVCGNCYYYCDNYPYDMDSDCGIVMGQTDRIDQACKYFLSIASDEAEKGKL